MVRTWPIDLSQPPEITLIGIGRHESAAEAYYLKAVWCLHLYRYTGEVVVDGLAHPIRPGMASIAPEGCMLEHRWHERPAMHVTVHFRQRQGAEPTAAIPWVTDLADGFEPVYRRFEAEARRRPPEYSRVTALLWHTLWDLASTGQGEPGRPPVRHPAVDAAVAWIEANLDQRLSVADVARHAGISQNHLIRLFRATHGTSIIGFIRHRRVEVARYLLATTDLPIKTIAAQVGLPDPQHFNKTFRSLTGRSPSEVRGGSGW